LGRTGPAFVTARWGTALAAIGASVTRDGYVGATVLALALLRCGGTLTDRVEVSARPATGEGTKVTRPPSIVLALRVRGALARCDALAETGAAIET